MKKMKKKLMLFALIASMTLIPLTSVAETEDQKIRRLYKDWQGWVEACAKKTFWQGGRNPLFPNLKSACELINVDWRKRDLYAACRIAKAKGGHHLCVGI